MKTMEKDFPDSGRSGFPEKKNGRPVNLPEFIQQAEAYRSQGRLDEAIETCRKGLEEMPDSLTGRMLLGRCYLEKERPPEAKKELEKVAREIEGCFPVYKLLSQVYLLEKNMDKALDALRKALFFSPGGESLKSSEPFGEANPLQPALPMSTFPARIDLPPKTPEDRETPPEKEKVEKTVIPTDTLADIYIRQGIWEKALAVYEKILAREPENTLVRRKLEALKRKIKGETEAPSRQQVIERLERWLAVISAKTKEGSPQTLR
jgi:predicted Zn-dependent protease